MYVCMYVCAVKRVLKAEEDVMRTAGGGSFEQKMTVVVVVVVVVMVIPSNNKFSNEPCLRVLLGKVSTAVHHHPVQPQTSERQNTKERVSSK
ncbi:uncharacterized protein K452DRAFT_73568 [Aplosporella prunicola CBS 121167]|uniref:Uncharacterized protein n=1 Tax=Aplosporella prunicola CBS 121167 TaxID=1176127 RepID=A0A6A6B736_9PEZI|nr:uncharacterized protein K452DRAFT_73568 [Aplosporella prunicola CBS 121167]KAF2139213.1 hypothetical protein K452DRAFT_73568 [Aplosporella prunicola CBS 121167]